MQVTLKQSEITAAIATYLTNVLGVSNVSPDTLAIVYKQGRSDKNGMTAELEIDAPVYEAKKAFSPDCAVDSLPVAQAAKLGNVHSESTVTPAETTSASAAPLAEVAPVAVAAVVETSLVDNLPDVAPAAEVEVPVYEGERRAVERVAEVEVAPVVEVAGEDLPVGGTEARVAELEAEVAAALAEDAAADLAEASDEAAPVTETSSALFG